MTRARGSINYKAQGGTERSQNTPIPFRLLVSPYGARGLQGDYWGRVHFGNATAAKFALHGPAFSAAAATPRTSSSEHAAAPFWVRTRVKVRSGLGLGLWLG